jgi:flagellar biosynthesis component FlhA
MDSTITKESHGSLRGNFRFTKGHAAVVAGILILLLIAIVIVAAIGYGGGWLVDRHLREKKEGLIRDKFTHKKKQKSSNTKLAPSKDR